MCKGVYRLWKNVNGLRERVRDGCDFGSRVFLVDALNQHDCCVPPHFDAVSRSRTSDGQSRFHVPEARLTPMGLCDCDRFNASCE